MLDLGLGYGKGMSVGLANQRSRVRFPAIPLSGTNIGAVLHAHVPVTKQYNLEPVKGR